MHHLLDDRPAPPLPPANVSSLQNGAGAVEVSRRGSQASHGPLDAAEPESVVVARAGRRPARSLSVRR